MGQGARVDGSQRYSCHTPIERCAGDVRHTLRARGTGTGGTEEAQDIYYRLPGGCAKVGRRQGVGESDLPAVRAVVHLRVIPRQSALLL